jgi:hypothetical protein
VTPADLIRDQLAVCGDEGVVPTTPAEVLATLTAQADPARAAWFAAMRAALAYLEADPTLPVPDRCEQTTIGHFFARDAFGEVEAVARRLGVTAEVRDGGDYCVALRDFGGGVVYEVVSHTQERMDRHAAEITYAGRVSP